MKRFATLMSTAALMLTAADAKMLNFEDFGMANGDLAAVAGTEFEDEYGIVFSSNDGLRIIKVEHFRISCGEHQCSSGH
ncbi:MAG: hypothetical protein AAF608_07380, partial [Pseudomonadota bacterium]